MFQYLFKFSAVIPEPMINGNSVSPTNDSTSSTFASHPVLAPVIIIPSDRKNSAALAVSFSEISFVIAWALKRNVG